MRRFVSCAALVWFLLPEALCSEEGSAKLRKFVSVETQMSERAAKIRIPPIRFHQTPWKEAILRVEALAQKQSPETVPPITFVPELVAGRYAARNEDTVTFEYPGGPFTEALRYIADHSGKCRVVATCHGLQIAGIPASYEVLPTFTFSLAPLIFDGDITPEEVGADRHEISDFWRNPRQYLVDKGVEFRPASYGSAFSVSGEWLSITDSYQQTNLMFALLEGIFAEDVPGPEVPKIEPEKKRIFDPALSGLMLKRVDFDGVALSDALETLNRQAREQGNKNPDSSIIVFPMERPAFGAVEDTELLNFLKTPIRYRAADISVFLAVSQIVQQAGGEILPDGAGITFRKKTKPEPRGYRLPPSLYAEDKPWSELGFDGWLKFHSIRYDEIARSYEYPIGLSANPDSHARVAKLVADAWQDYYASDAWKQELKRQKRLQEHLLRALKR